MEAHVRREGMLDSFKRLVVGGGRRKQGGVVVKTTPKLTDFGGQDIDNTRAVLYSLLLELPRHMNCMCVHSMREDKHTYRLELEKMNGGELFDFLCACTPEKRGQQSEQLCRGIIGQVLRGLHHLHTYGVLHRDIKPENIMFRRKPYPIKRPHHLIGKWRPSPSSSSVCRCMHVRNTCDIPSPPFAPSTSSSSSTSSSVASSPLPSRPPSPRSSSYSSLPQPPTQFLSSSTLPAPPSSCPLCFTALPPHLDITLIDLDSCRPLQLSSCASAGVRRVVGTPAYMAPEVLQGADPTVGSDLWAVGILLYVMLTGVPPMKMYLMTTPKKAWTVLRLQRERGFDFSLSPFDSWPGALDLCKRLLDFNPTTRCQSAVEALLHPWMNYDNISSNYLSAYYKAYSPPTLLLPSRDNCASSSSSGLLPAARPSSSSTSTTPHPSPSSSLPSTPSPPRRRTPPPLPPPLAASRSPPVLSRLPSSPPSPSPTTLASAPSSPPPHLAPACLHEEPLQLLSPNITGLPIYDLPHKSRTPKSASQEFTTGNKWVPKGSSSAHGLIGTSADDGGGGTDTTDNRMVGLPDISKKYSQTSSASFDCPLSPPLRMRTSLDDNITALNHSTDDETDMCETVCETVCETSWTDGNKRVVASARGRQEGATSVIASDMCSPLRSLPYCCVSSSERQPTISAVDLQKGQSQQHPAVWSTPTTIKTDEQWNDKIRSDDVDNLSRGGGGGRYVFDLGPDGSSFPSSAFGGYPSPPPSLLLSPPPLLKLPFPASPPTGVFHFSPALLSSSHSPRNLLPSTASSKLYHPPLPSSSYFQQATAASTVAPPSSPATSYCLSGADHTGSNELRMLLGEEDGVLDEGGGGGVGGGKAERRKGEAEVEKEAGSILFVVTRKRRKGELPTHHSRRLERGSDIVDEQQHGKREEEEEEGWMEVERSVAV
eukprot:GHVS01019443.1.p1 GENE.GHVS01019443.1~~GHVS01019443.1.p1  ORF type:complete len:937 (-),score=260.63 GHVS01019443.1:844-3654(-)